MLNVVIYAIILLPANCSCANLRSGGGQHGGVAFRFPPANRSTGQRAIAPGVFGGRGRGETRPEDDLQTAAHLIRAISGFGHHCASYPDEESQRERIIRLMSDKHETWAKKE